MDVMGYNPSRGPDPKRWLWLPDDVRLDEVMAYHKKSRVKLPNAHLHVLMHVVLENQLAEGHEAATHALHRLLSQGLDRHEAIHAIAWVFAQQIHGVLQGSSPEFDREAYVQALETLSAESWKRSAG